MESEETILTPRRPKNKFVLLLTMFATVFLIPIAMFIGIIIGIAFGFVISWDWLCGCADDIKFCWNNSKWFGI